MPFWPTLNNTLYIHIPKTGGSSIDLYMCRKVHGESYCMDDLNSENFNQHLIGFMPQISHSLQHCTFLELQRNANLFNINFELVNIFASVRNPYHRLISDLFFYKIISSTDPVEIIEEAIFAHLDNNDMLDNHKLPQYKFLINENEEIASEIKIIRNETLQMDMIALGFFDFNVTVNKTFKNEFDYMRLLTQKAISRINEYYQKDFEYLGYEFYVTELI